jgi:hypothetical protein
MVKQEISQLWFNVNSMDTQYIVVLRNEENIVQLAKKPTITKVPIY